MADTANSASPGLIVLLPLVGAILGAVVGGIVGAWANSWYRDREAKKAEDREREGLLSLICAELVVNDALFDTVNKPAALARRLETGAWDQSQTRLSQLLPATEIQPMVTYYGQLKLLRDDLKLTTADMSASHKGMITTVKLLGDGAGDIAQKYIDDPGFLSWISLQRRYGRQRQYGSSQPDVIEPL